MSAEPTELPPIGLLDNDAMRVELERVEQRLMALRHLEAQLEVLEGPGWKETRVFVTVTRDNGVMRFRARATK